jgi:hypothetical protein
MAPTFNLDAEKEKTVKICAKYKKVIRGPKTLRSYTKYISPSKADQGTRDAEAKSYMKHVLLPDCGGC